MIVNVEIAKKSLYVKLEIKKKVTHNKHEFSYSKQVNILWHL